VSVVSEQRLVDVLQPHILSSRSTLARTFQRADPFPNIVVDNFLQSEVCDRLLREFPPFERGCALNERGLPGGKSTCEQVRELGGIFTRIDDIVRSQEFLALIGEISGIEGLLYDPDYLGGGTHENRSTQDLDPHVDFNFHPRQRWHRRLNLIVYLNPEWDEAWGGALELHSDPWRPLENRIKTVAPLHNRCIMFETSERSWHGFRKIAPPADRPNLSRRSFAIYLYSEDRPKEETGPPHATVYVPRPLPAGVREGESLSADLLDQITTLMTRRTQQIEFLGRRDEQLVTATMERLQLTESSQRNAALLSSQADTLHWLIGKQDEYLRYLYDREKEFTSRMQQLDLASRATLPLDGGLQLISDVDGYWGDQWAGANLRFRMRASRKFGAIRIAGLLPAAIAVQELSVSVADKTWSRWITPGEFTWNVPFSGEAGATCTVRVQARYHWEPSRTGESGDSRQLAWHVHAVEAV
jgi:hypothetical protein